MHQRQRWVVHESVADTVDSLLRGHQPSLQVRTVNEKGAVTITREVPMQVRSKGQVLPFPQVSQQERILGKGETRSVDELQQFDRVGNQASSSQPQDLPRLHVYPYGISHHQIEQVIEMLNLPIVLTKNVDSAEAILALRAHLRKHSNLGRMAQERQIPIYTIKANTISQLTRTLGQVLGMDEPDTMEDREKNLFTQSDRQDEIDALEEARLAVEQIVIPKGQPVELLPRSARVRQMQHQLVEHYRLKSDSFGSEPNCRLRIYPV
jgi:hypothetical protein